jgi:hypothetical protein
MGFLKKLFGEKRATSQSASATGFPYVYVNQDGSVRELSPNEQKYLSTEFSGADGGRPYVKPKYETRNGWGSQSGYLQRNLVPKHLTIEPVKSNYDMAVKEFDQNFMQTRWNAERAAGDTVTVHPDGSISSTPNPTISPKERFDLIRAYNLAEQRKREALANVDTVSES